MKQQCLAAYLNLIQDLLTCPQGEEWIHLKNQEDLVDVPFLQVMEQVANQLARQGDLESATFLHNWAAKLHHILVKEIQPPSPEGNTSQAYLDVVQKLLASPRGMANEILQAHQALMGPGLVHTMHEIVRQLIRQDDIEPAQFLEKLAHQINQKWLKEHDFQANLKKVPVHQASTTSPVAVSTASDGIPAPSSPAFTQPQPPVINPYLGDSWNSPTEADIKLTSAPSSAPTQSPPSSSVPDAKSPETSSGTQSAEVTVPPNQASTQAIAAGLSAMAQALQQLSQTLAVQRSPHPLWYLEILEQACTANWQLTTEEVEQLIGVKPHCHKDEIVYQRGNWCFTKVGKLGGKPLGKSAKRGLNESICFPNSQFSQLTITQQNY